MFLNPEGGGLLKGFPNRYLLLVPRSFSVVGVALLVVIAGVVLLFANAGHQGVALMARTPAPRSLGGVGYTNSTFGFSFTIPAGYAVRELPANPGDDTTVILIESQNQSTAEDGLELDIAPTDEADTPAGQGPLGGAPAGIQQLDTDPLDAQAVGTVFVRGNEQYQLTTYLRLSPTLRQLLSTWRFL